MMRFIRGLVDWRRRPQPATAANPLVAAPVSAPDWTRVERDQLDRFLRSPAGLALAGRVRAVSYRNAIEGCKDAFHTTHSAGKAAGFEECWLYIESLSRSARDIAEPDMQSPGQGEATLHEQYSP